MPSIESLLDKVLYELTMAHLAKLDAYVPGPVKQAGGTKEKLLAKYAADPLFSIWGLDSVEYASATLGGGTVTSIHRKLGDIYEESVALIFQQALNQQPSQVTYSAVIQSGDREENRSADAYLQFDCLKARARRRISRWCDTELKKLTTNPMISLIGVAMEIRHCYQTGDSKRCQADEAMARHLLVSGILPVMPLFCNQSNPGIVKRYRSVWIVKEGMESYEMVRTFTGYDYFGFLLRNREDFRKVVISVLRELSR